GIARIVLDPQLLQAELGGQPARVDETGQAGLGVGEGRDVARHGEQRLITPDVPRAGGDLLAGDRRVVVTDLERCETLRTRVERSEGGGRTTLPTAKLGGVAERSVAGSGRRRGRGVGVRRR